MVLAGVIPLALHHVVRKMDIHRTIETVIGTGPKIEVPQICRTRQPQPVGPITSPLVPSTQP
ncbi:hypothetical protein WCLP8_3290006 [uncultured Gammaproteobacteria bacterium]